MKTVAFTDHKFIYKAMRMETFFLSLFSPYLPHPRQTNDFGPALRKEGRLNVVVDQGQEDIIHPHVNIFYLVHRGESGRELVLNKLVVEKCCRSHWNRQNVIPELKKQGGS